MDFDLIDQPESLITSNSLLSDRDKFIGFKPNKNLEIEQQKNIIIYDDRELLKEKKRQLAQKKHLKKRHKNSNKEEQSIKDELCTINHDKKEIIKNALENVRDKIHCQVAAIFLFSKDGTLKRVGINGLDKNKKLIKNDWLSKENYIVGESLIGKAAEPKEKIDPDEKPKYGTTQITNDFETDDPKYKKHYLGTLGELAHAIAVPLNGANKTYGVLKVINKIDSEGNIVDFNDDDYTTLLFLVGVISCRISNFRRDTQRDFLNNIKNSLVKSENSTFNYYNSYQEILNFLISIETAFKVAILRVKNDDTGAMKVRYSAYAKGVRKKKDDDPRRIREGFVGIVSDELEPVIVPKITANGMRDEFINADWIKDNGFESFGCFPLIIPESDEIVGTISLFAGYEYEFHYGTIKFLNYLTSSLATLIGKEKKKKKIEIRFNALVQEWRDKAGFFSSTKKAVEHPAYQQIIGMGEDAIPLLLKELEKHSGRWFTALRKITGENPVPPEMRGMTEEMIKVWIDWGYKKGYIN